MKKIIFIIIFFCFKIVFGQLGEYEITFDGWAEGANNHHCGYAYVELEFQNSSNNYKAFEFNYRERSARVYYSAGSNETTSRCPANQRLKSLNFWA